MRDSPPLRRLKPEDLSIRNKHRLAKQFVLLSTLLTFHQPANGATPEATAILPTETSVLGNPPQDSRGMRTYRFSQGEWLADDQEGEWLGQSENQDTFALTTQKFVAGLNTAKTGTSIRKVGWLIFVPGLVVTGIGVATYFSGGEGALYLGGGMLAAGGLTIYTGTAGSAYGTSVAHRALAKAGAIPQLCIHCLVSWAALVPHPYTVWITVPLSISISKSHRKWLVGAYQNYRNGQSRSQYLPTLRISPIATRSGPGLGLAGEF